GSNFEGEGVNYCKRKRIVGCYLTKLPTVCSSGNQKIKVLPLICSPVFRTVKKSGAGPAGRSAAILGKVRQRTGGFGGLQMAADYCLHHIPFCVACGGAFGPLAKSLGILVTHDRGSCAKRTVSPRGFAVRGNGPCHGGIVAIEALSGAGTVGIDSGGIGRSLVVVRVTANILFRLFQVATVVGAVECRVAGRRAHYLRSMGIVAVEALDVVSTLRSS